MSNLFGPNGQPIDATKTATATLGGQEMEYFLQPGVARSVPVDLKKPVYDPLGNEIAFEAKVQAQLGAVAQLVGMHDAGMQALIREIVKLRERVHVLESCEDSEGIIQ